MHDFKVRIYCTRTNKTMAAKIRIAFKIAQGNYIRTLSPLFSYSAWYGFQEHKQNSESPHGPGHKNKCTMKKKWCFAEQLPVAHRLWVKESLGSISKLRKNIYEYMQDEDFHNRSRDLMCEGRDKASYGCECGALWCCAGFATVGGALFTRRENPYH